MDVKLRNCPFTKKWGPWKVVESINGRMKKSDEEGISDVVLVKILCVYDDAGRVSVNGWKMSPR